MEENHFEQSEQLLPLFQTEGRVYVSGRSGSGKTTLFLNRLQYLKNLQISFKNTLNIVAYKEDTTHLSYLWKSEFDPLGEDDQPIFRTFYQFCYNVIHRYNKLHGGQDPHVSRDFRHQVSKIITDCFEVRMNHYELDQVYRKLSECKGLLLPNSEIAKISYPGIDFLHLYQQFEQYKKQRSLMSYEDLMAEAYQCLLKDSQLRTQLMNHYRYIHVDDAQNLSFSAYMILKLISNEDTMIVLFVDLDQFAGNHAPYAMSFDGFASSYPDARHIELSENYRCDVNIDEMIQKFMHSEHDFHLQDDSVVRFITAKDLEASYRNALVLAKNDPNTVFLAREHFTLLPLADLLDQEGLSFTVSDFHGFYRDNTIHDLVNLFRLMIDPSDFKAFCAVQKKIGFCLSERNLNEVGQCLHQDESLDVYSAIVNSNIRSSVKNRVIMHIEEIRIAQRLDSIKLLLFVLTKLHYEDYIKEKGVTIKNPNILVFATMAQRYPEPLQLLKRLAELESLGDDQVHATQLYSFSQVKGKEFEKVCFLDCLDAFYQVFPDQQLEQKLLYSVLSKVSKNMVFLVAKTAFMQRMQPHAFINDLYHLMKTTDAKDKATVKEAKRKQPTKANLRPGKRIIHQSLGSGRVRRVNLEDDEIEIVFGDGVAKRLKLSACLESGLIAFH